MKLADSTTTTSSSRTVESHTMGIDKAHMAHVINLLTDAYSNPTLAVLREYSANALDAHRAARNPDPIHVSLPSALNPLLTISDNGLGLSKDEIIKVYSQYGASTKRDTNEQIGGFGIGAKSAFAVADQFTVIAVKDGMRTAVVFSRSSEGGSVNVVNERETDEMNGVKVSISVSSDFEAYRREAENLFRYWKPSEVVVEGTTIEFLSETAITVSPQIQLHPVSGYGAAHIAIRMGGIAYQLDRSDLNFIFGGNSYSHPMIRELDGANMAAVLDTDIGTVDLAPSREALIMNEKAKRTLSHLILNAKQTTCAYFQNKLDAEANQIDAIAYYRVNREPMVAFCSPLTYKGQVLPIVPKNVDAADAHVGHKTVKVSDHINWNNSHPIVIVDTAGHKLEKGTTKTKWGMVIERTGEYIALHHGNNGAIRKQIGTFMRTIVGENLTGFDRPLTDNGHVIFVIKHQVKNDPFLAACNAHEITLDDMIARVKAYRKDQAKAKRLAAASANPSSATVYVNSGLRYDTVNQNVSLAVAEILAYDHVFYMTEDEAKEMRKMSHNRSLASIVDVDNLPDNSVVLVIKSTQKVDVFAKRIVKHSTGRLTPVGYFEWHKADTVKAIESLSAIELHYIATEDDGSDVYSNIIQPLAACDKCPITSEAFTTMLTPFALLEKTSLNHDRIAAILSRARVHGIDIPKVETGIEAMQAQYPLMECIAGSLYSAITLSHNEPTAKAFYQMVEAIDHLNSTRPAAQATIALAA